MKKTIVVLMMFMFFITALAYADDYKYIPANIAHIINTVKELKYNPKLEVEIFGYVEVITKDNDTDLIENVLKVRECFLDAGIDKIRINIGLGNKGGIIEEKFKFKKDGVYIKLCSD